MSYVSSDEKDETYWLGVRDALRMVDSFVRWSARHEDKAKNLQEFISEGLIAAAKRCESCLSTTLGLTFGESLGGRSPDDLLEPADPTDRLPTGLSGSCKKNIKNRSCYAWAFTSRISHFLCRANTSRCTTRRRSNSCPAGRTNAWSATLQEPNRLRYGD